MVEILPSILAADFARLAEEIQRVEAAGADWLHVDVMDGHFVPNLTIGPPVIKAIDAVTQLPLDVHLMVDEPYALLADFIDAESNNLTVHVEACRHLHRTIQHIKEAGVQASVVLNPATPLYMLHEILPEVHMVLLMSVSVYWPSVRAGEIPPWRKSVRPSLSTAGFVRSHCPRSVSLLQRSE